MGSQIIRNPDLTIKYENKSRPKVLKDYRDWFEDDVYVYGWKLVELTLDNVRGFHYIDYSYWNELSDNAHLVGVAADNTRRGKIVFDVSNTYFFDIAKAVETEVHFTPIVVLER